MDRPEETTSFRGGLDPCRSETLREMHQRAADVHRKAAQLHDESARLHEQHAFEMRTQPERRARAQRLAVTARLAAARERRSEALELSRARA